MATRNWLMDPVEVVTSSSVIPVLVIEDIADAVPIAKAFIAGGINVLEVTLRTPVALEAIAQIAQHFPDAIVGAGTVTNAEQLIQATEAGAKFAISPGLTPELLDAANQGSIPLIPGVSSISELMLGLDRGYLNFKFFPAEASGGTKALKAMAGPFPNVTFCPTGGVNGNNYLEYLALGNVKCCGGSWVCPENAIKNKQWSLITNLAKIAVTGRAA